MEESAILRMRSLVPILREIYTEKTGKDRMFRLISELVGDRRVVTITICVFVIQGRQFKYYLWTVVWTSNTMEENYPCTKGLFS